MVHGSFQLVELELPDERSCASFSSLALLELTGRGSHRCCRAAGCLLRLRCIVDGHSCRPPRDEFSKWVEAPHEHRRVNVQPAAAPTAKTGRLGCPRNHRSTCTIRTKRTRRLSRSHRVARTGVQCCVSKQPPSVETAPGGSRAWRILDASPDTLPIHVPWHLRWDARDLVLRDALHARQSAGD